MRDAGDPLLRVDVERAGSMVWSTFLDPSETRIRNFLAMLHDLVRVDEMREARERSLDAALVRLRSQILFCEEASGRGRRTLESYGWTEHDVLCAAFRRARYDGDGLIEASRAFLDEQSDLRARADHVHGAPQKEAVALGALLRARAFMRVANPFGGTA